MSNAAPNHIKYLLATKAIDFSADAFKIILMQSAFVYNKDTHALYADVIGSELATANGYTQGAKALAGVAAGGAIRSEVRPEPADCTQSCPTR